MLPLGHDVLDDDRDQVVVEVRAGLGRAAAGVLAEQTHDEVADGKAMRTGGRRVESGAGQSQLRSRLPPVPNRSREGRRRRGPPSDWLGPVLLGPYASPYSQPPARRSQAGTRGGLIARRRGLSWLHASPRSVVREGMTEERGPSGLVLTVSLLSICAARTEDGGENGASVAGASAASPVRRSMRRLPGSVPRR